MEGLPGPQGITGPTGIVGPTGIQGVQGQQGILGITGTRGPTGVQGLLGLPRPSVPVGIQMFAGDSTVEVQSVNPVGVIAPITISYPSLTPTTNLSTTIPNMSMSFNTITVPAGTYLVEGACTFPDTGINSGRIELATDYSPPSGNTPASYTPFMSGNVITSGSGMTSSFSGLHTFQGTTLVSVMYSVATGSSLSITCPFLYSGSKSFFVTFVKV